MKRFEPAFTLAEVLITLGIIGIVAVLTIPPLISKYEKHVIEVGIKKTYLDLYNAIKKSEEDNGPVSEWDWGDNNFINRYLAPYIHLNSCKNKCFAWRADGAWRIPNGDIVGDGSPKYLLDDGRSIMFKRTHAQYTGGKWANYMHFLVDVNGQRGKSVVGKDVFWFTLEYHEKGSPRGNHNGFFAGITDDYFANDKFLYSNCNYGQIHPHACAVILQRNGWRFPDDYPIKF